MKLCSFSSGSSGNCIYVESDNASILVDCGVSAKYINDCLNKVNSKSLDAILITHEHLDHIKSLGTIMRKKEVPVYLTEKTLLALKNNDKLGLVNDNQFNIIKADSDFKIKDVEVMPFKISHDAAEPVCYRFASGGKNIAIATDLGEYDDYIIYNLKDLDAILIEANHELRMLDCGSYPWYLKERIKGSMGHLSNDDSAKLLTNIISDKTKNILLGHLSSSNNQEELAKLTVSSFLKSTRRDLDIKNVNIEVARKNIMSSIVDTKITDRIYTSDIDKFHFSDNISDLSSIRVRGFDHGRK